MRFFVDSGGPSPVKKLGLPALSAEDIDRFHRQGFLAIERFTTPEDLARIRTILDELYARFRQLPPEHTLDLGDEGRHDGIPQIPEINWTLRLAPRLRTALAFARCGALAEQLLGCRALHTGYDHAILKPPRNERATPWHQDQAYTEDRGPLSGLHFWIPLQEVTVEMGCMHFIPGSHLGAVLPHRRRGGRTSAHVMEAESVDTSAAVACPLPAGGATVHLPRTLHYTGPNLTDQPRLAWSLEFGPPRIRWWRRYLSACLSRTSTLSLGLGPREALGL
jgi:hypothetical protein